MNFKSALKPRIIRLLLPYFTTVIILTINSSFAAVTTISDIYNKSNSCDYLIITYAALLPCAEPLAQYRDTAVKDDVDEPAILLMENVYQTIKDASLNPGEKLFKALKWAYGNWSGFPDYIVLFGNDSLSYNSVDSSWVQHGPVPTYVYKMGISYNMFVCDYSDRYFTYLKDPKEMPPDTLSVDGLTSVTVGRIPCTDSTEGRAYLEKLITYDNAPPSPRRDNSSFHIADDNFINAETEDPMGSFFYSTADSLKKNYFSAFFRRNLYLSLYERDLYGLHNLARESFFACKAKGSGNIIYVGHGMAANWAEYSFLSTECIQNDETDTIPSTIISMSCYNANFAYAVPYGNMFRKMLTKEKGGAILCMGFTKESHVSAARDLVFRLLKDASLSPETPLGRILQNSTAKCSKELLSREFFYCILGDPALKPKIGPNNIAVAKLQDAPSFQCRTAFENGSYACETSVMQYKKFVDDTTIGTLMDTVVFTKTGTFADGEFWVNVPSDFADSLLSFSVFAWNEHSSSRGIWTKDSAITYDLSVATPFCAALPDTMKSPEITILRSGLLIKCAKPSTVSLLDISGRTVAGKRVLSFTQPVSFNYNTLGNGVYILRIASSEGFYCRRIIFN